MHLVALLDVSVIGISNMIYLDLQFEFSADC